MRNTQRRPRFEPLPRPILKWAGGKGQLLSKLTPAVDKAWGTVNAGELPFVNPAPAAPADPAERLTYHEPFVGGGALFFELFRSGRLEGKSVALSDVNGPLIEMYQAVRDAAEQVIEKLAEYAARHSRDHYYEVRKCVPPSPAERAARLIYLNRTCFNGLYRENRNGEFNVPMGKYRNPRICDAENLRAAARALQPVSIERRPFEAVLEHVRPGDLVYFDPPYEPVSATASFTQYDREGFGGDQQRALAHVYAELDERGVYVVLSNSNTPLIQQLYAGYCVHQVYANRAVNSKGNGRGKVEEVIVTNFPVP